MMGDGVVRPAAGIFVGGGSTRMGRPKGRLRAPGGGETLVDRLVRLAREAGLEPLLVGEAGPYADLASGVPRIADDPIGVGPLGGLRALLRARPVALAIACDMPAVDAAMLEALRDAPPAAVVAPRRRYWEALCARYQAKEVLPAIDEALARGEHSLQRLLKRLPTRELALPAERLVDWDTPADVTDDAAHEAD